MIETFLEYVEYIIGVPTSGYVIWLLEHPEDYHRIKAWLIKPVMGGSKLLQKHFIASDLQNKINRFSRHLIHDMDEKDIFDAKIEWQESSTLETFFDQKKIVIKMDYTDNANKNLTIATLAYVSQSLIRKSKPFIEPQLRKAIDLIASKKIIDSHAAPHEKNYFNNVYLFPAIESDKTLNDDCEKLSLLDQKGYFSRLYLRELRYLGELLDGTYPTNEIKNEIRDFLTYLYNVSNVPMIQQGGTFLEADQFEFRGRYIKARILLMAIPHNVEKRHITPYIRRIKQGIRSGSEIFYILASEHCFELFSLFKRDLERRLVKQNILKLTCDRTYYLKKSPTEKVKHKCIVYRKIGTFDDALIDKIFEDIEDQSHVEVAKEQPVTTASLQ